MDLHLGGLRESALPRLQALQALGRRKNEQGRVQDLRPHSEGPVPQRHPGPLQLHSAQTYWGSVSKASALHMKRVAEAGCVVCNRFGGGHGRVEVHHVAEGSGVRSDFATTGLCEAHHRGEAGLHGMGTKAFLRLYRPLGETEWGLLVWSNEDMAKLFGRSLA